ncbi:hypothetical protein NLY10_29235 [Streptomyces sp. MAR25Y5]|nr:MULTISPECIES: hypothetical protein [unclassified Streptomyces]MCP3770707.1 hypothetical protein [Streptomyces sp. MAR25Y5]
MLQSPPALLELGGGAFSERADASDQAVRGSSIGMQGLLRLSLRAADRDEDADAGADVALVGQGGQAVGCGLVQRGQGVDAGGGDVGDAAGLGVGDPQRGAVRGGQKLDVSAECLVFLAEPVPLGKSSLLVKPHIGTR